MVRLLLASLLVTGGIHAAIAATPPVGVSPRDCTTGIDCLRNDAGHAPTDRAETRARAGDADGDGYNSTLAGGTDCNDANAAINPGASETCNGVDDNCSGRADEDPIDGYVYYTDADRDGYGTTTYTRSCSSSTPSGYSTNSLDCNDAAGSVNPGQAEFCDSIDNDCDGSTDEGVGTTYYRDSDSDSFGDPAASTMSCSLPSGYVANDLDCDDSTSLASPTEEETCDGIDNDCNGVVDDAGGRYWYRDSDSDGWGDPDTGTFGCTAPSGYVLVQGDCDDSDPYVYSGAPEVCNGYDDDCDGGVDEEGTLTWYLDNDGDGYGNPGRTAAGCTAPANYVGNDDDCNDSSSSVNPGAAEICNSIDDDCDGSVDDGAGVTYYADSDRDTYGDPAATRTACSMPSGYVATGSDCDDTRASVNPAGTETCNSLDDDCDGSVDNGIGATWYNDADSDGFGNASVTTRNCSLPTGYTADDNDCDDTLSTVYPGATEYCNDIDDDCDTIIDNDAFDVSTWYEDLDSDGWGNVNVSEMACDAPTGFVGPSGDCWDDDASVNPGAPELADGVDQDCDGIVDENTDNYDDDGDGFSELGGDCDDATFDVNPAMTEGCDGEDDDCDGIIDEDTRCYDDDGDGYSEDDADCNDEDASIGPDATEDGYNGIDDDCDGVIDSGTSDPDHDGVTYTGGDCDESNGTVHPGAAETANGVDDDCDGIIDEGTEAYDDDGDGTSEDDGDCNDNNADTYEGAEEPTDGQDNDCDGMVDEGGPNTDDDGDGFSEEEGDCDDTNSAISPTSAETLDGVDENCDGFADEGLIDADDDGFLPEDGDCDDTNGWAFPGGEELCDEVDNDCNGVVDDNCVEEETEWTKPGACGCGTGSAMPGLVPLALGVALALRRRRE